LPSLDLVVDYFRWRNEDAHRNALSSHCYWTLRKQGKDAAAATSAIQGLSTAAKNELLFQEGINFNELPLWQRRGVGMYWETFDRPSTNATTQEPSIARRRRLRRELELPMKEQYSDFLRGLLSPS
jgi:tRNA(His) 5'-end guanylyltransferase